MADYENTEGRAELNVAEFSLLGPKKNDSAMELGGNQAKHLVEGGHGTPISK